MKSVIREIRPTELSGCAGVIRKAFAENNEPFVEDLSQIDERRLIFESDNGCLMFGLFNEIMQTGFVQLDIKENELVLKKLCILPELQGQGLGRRLLEFSKKKTAEMGYKRLSAVIHADNARLEKFLLSLGFEKTETRELSRINLRVSRLEIGFD